VLQVFKGTLDAMMGSKNRKWKKPQSPAEGIQKNMTRMSVPRAQKGDAPSHPSHVQMAVLVGYLLLPSDRQLVIKNMNTIIAKSKIGNDCNTGEGTKIGKTPLHWLQMILPKANVMITVESVFDICTASATGYLMQCVLNRQAKFGQTKGNKESQMSDRIPILKYVRDQGTDNQWMTVILLLPHSGVFYVAHHAANSQMGLKGLPMSWLRIQRGVGQPSSGSFIKSIQKCYSVYFGMDQSTKTWPCYQMDDYEEGSPLIPPDKMNGVMIICKKEARLLYNQGVKRAESRGSFKYGCRRYVKAAHHVNIPKSALILDQRVTGDVHLAITVRDFHGRVSDISYIQISAVQSDSNLMSLLSEGSERIKSTPGNCRQHAGDEGRMYGIGEMKIAGSEKFVVTKPTQILANDGLLGRINAASLKFGLDKLSTVVQTMKHQETQANRIPVEAMGGDNSPSCSMAISSNLGNATHYDVADGSVGYSVWMELKPGEATNWYFVLPNIMIKKGGVTYNGVAVQLFHGASVAWDGRIIRHGTTITNTNNSKNRCMGWFWSADMRATTANLAET
jgi:hypothetical protein